LNSPLIAFQTSTHAGALGKTFSIVNVNNSRVRIMALKKAEASDEYIVRLVETDGRPQPNVRIAFAAPVSAAREVNGQEQSVGPASVNKGELVGDFGIYQPRTFAIKLAPPANRMSAPQSLAVTLPFNLATATLDGSKSTGGFDAAGNALPAEMIPAALEHSGIRFDLAAGTQAKPNALVTRGQTMQLPPGRFNRLYLLAASANGAQKASFRIGSEVTEVVVQTWDSYVGQWDNRIWKTTTTMAGNPPQPRTNPYGEMTGITPGFIK